MHKAGEATQMALSQNNNGASSEQDTTGPERPRSSYHLFTTPRRL